jgi:peptidoglycan hydrolase-like protein with peptidoglycan-binding domain
MRLVPVLVAVTMALALTTPALAERRGMVVVNAAAEEADAPALIAALRSRGFTTTGGAALALEAIRAGLSDLHAGGAPAERIVVALIGRFVHSPAGGWFLGAGADEPDLVGIGAEAIDLATVWQVATQAPAGAVILLGEVEGAAGPGLAPGAGPLDALPPGITVIRGSPEAVAGLLTSDLLAPGTPVVDALAARPDMEAAGLLLPGLALIPAGEAPVAVSPALPDAIAAAELRDWESAQRVGTTAAYEAFLDSWPTGRFAAQARAARAVLATPPAPPQPTGPEAVEQALGLDREDRRRVQRALVDLGYNTRGVDGIFGPATRSALGAWQRSAGLGATGFLAPGQIALLQGDADRARAAREAEDRAYWRSTGASGSEAGLRAYLARYPNGLFATEARRTLAAIEADRNAASDDAAWRHARRADTVAAYRAYLREWPRGRHAADAQRRIDQIEGSDSERVAWDRARSEDSIGGYQEYLRRWPNGRHATEARRRIERLTAQQTPTNRDDIAWTIARRQDTPGAYMAYLAEFPNGRHAGEALVRLTGFGRPLRPQPR